VGDTEVVNLRLNAPKTSVDELQAMLPSMEVILPSWSQLEGGTLSTELAITGDWTSCDLPEEPFFFSISGRLSPPCPKPDLLSCARSVYFSS
jgi:hypothetical protein